MTTEKSLCDTVSSTLEQMRNILKLYKKLTGTGLIHMQALYTTYSLELTVLKFSISSTSVEDIQKKRLIKGSNLAYRLELTLHNILCSIGHNGLFKKHILLTFNRVKSRLTSILRCTIKTYYKIKSTTENLINAIELDNKRSHILQLIRSVNYLQQLFTIAHTKTAIAKYLYNVFNICIDDNTRRLYASIEYVYNRITRRCNEATALCRE